MNRITFIFCVISCYISFIYTLFDIPLQNYIASNFVTIFWYQPSVLWRCWLGGRKGIRPVKNWVVRSWCGICLEQGVGLHMAQLMPSPLTVSCFSKIQIGFSFLVLAHPGSPRQRAIKRVCVFLISEKGATQYLLSLTLRIAGCFSKFIHWRTQ